MSIPFYFAMEESEAEPQAGKRYAQLGYGFYDDGTLRMPAKTIPNAPAVINDRYLPAKAPEAAVLDRLAEVCGNGCFLDFERPIGEVSIAVAVGLQQRLRAKITVPPALHAICPDANVQLPGMLCNSWEIFVRTAQVRYEDQWVVEIIPWYTSMPSFGRSKEGFLETAICRYKVISGSTILYDTEETIKRKLALAEAHGCRAGIVLLREYLQCQKSAQFE